MAYLASESHMITWHTPSHPHTPTPSHPHTATPCWLQAWDDVERKVKPVERPYDYSRARPLDQEKSKRSLAEVYEEEYLKTMQVAPRAEAARSLCTRGKSLPIGISSGRWCGVTLRE